MEVKFKIIDVLPEQHMMIVRYYTDVLTEDSLASSFDHEGKILRKEDGSPQRCQTDYSINLWQTTPSMTEEDVKNLAKISAPFDWFQMKHDVLDPNVDTSMSSAFNLLNQEFIAERPNQQIENKTIDDDEIEKLIQQLLNNSSANT